MATSEVGSSYYVEGPKFSFDNVLSHCFIIDHIFGRGLGMIAKYDIPRGRRILYERPFFNITLPTSDVPESELSNRGYNYQVKCSTMTFKDCLRQVSAALRLCREEGLGRVILARLHFDAFQIASAYGDQARATEFLERFMIGMAVCEGMEEGSAVHYYYDHFASLLNTVWDGASRTSTLLKFTPAGPPRGRYAYSFEKWLWCQ